MSKNHLRVKNPNIREIKALCHLNHSDHYFKIQSNKTQQFVKLELIFEPTTTKKELFQFFISFFFVLNNLTIEKRFESNSPFQKSKFRAKTMGYS